MKYDIITIIGPTASGKTKLATSLAIKMDSEIISGDSRQIYKYMDLGTGKDIDEYTINGTSIPYHLIDIAYPGYKYSIYDYQHDFINAYNAIKKKRRIPILCGGSGLYIESVLKNYRLQPVPPNIKLREALEGINLEELSSILSSYKNLHNKTDTDSKKRAIRGIEIAEYYNTHSIGTEKRTSIKSLTIGLTLNREERWKRIHNRLIQRLNEGMVNEVECLLDKGVKAEDLIYYGLEYKYLTLFITKKISYNEMLQKLEIAIRQFSKRQMTWFRGMQRRGICIHWIDATWPLIEQLEQIQYWEKEYQ